MGYFLGQPKVITGTLIGGARRVGAREDVTVEAEAGEKTPHCWLRRWGKGQQAETCGWSLGSGKGTGMHPLSEPPEGPAEALILDCGSPRPLGDHVMSF